MSNRSFLGAAEAVAQIATGSIDSVDGTPANNDFHVTINGQVVTVTGDTDVATTAAALLAALIASTHPYFSSVTWTNPSAGTIIGTSKDAGDPFVAALTETGAGTGAVTDFAATQAATGPHWWDNADNWLGGAVPITGDDVVLENSGISIRHGFAQSAVTLASFVAKKSYTGKVGLQENAFATSADGDTFTLDVQEYRDRYLNIKSTLVDLGENLQSTIAEGSGLFKLDLDSAASTVVIHGSATAIEANKPAIQLLANSASTKIFIRKATGGVGVAVGAPFETSLIDSVDVGDDMSSNGVQIGDGVTFTSFSQKSGENFVESAATMPLLDILGGTCTTEGVQLITAANVGDDAQLNSYNVPSGGVAITTLTIKDGGKVDTLENSDPRTFTNVNQHQGSSLDADTTILTITTHKIVVPTGKYSLSVA